MNENHHSKHNANSLNGCGVKTNQTRSDSKSSKIFNSLAWQLGSFVVRWNWYTRIFFLPWLHGNLPDWQQQDVPSWSASSSVLHSGICGFIIIFFVSEGFLVGFFFGYTETAIKWNLMKFIYRKLISLIPWKCLCNSKEIKCNYQIYMTMYVHVRLKIIFVWYSKLDLKKNKRFSLLWHIINSNFNLSQFVNSTFIFNKFIVWQVLV